MRDGSVWQRHFGERAPWPHRRLGKTLEQWRLRRIEVDEEHDEPRDQRLALRRMPRWVRLALWWEDRVRSKAALERRLQAVYALLHEQRAATTAEYQEGYKRGYTSGRQDEKAEAMAAARAAKVTGA